MKKYLVPVMLLAFALALYGFGKKAQSPEPVDEAGRLRIERTEALMKLHERDKDLYIRFDSSTGCVATLEGDLSDAAQGDPLEIAYGFMEHYASLMNIKDPRQEFVLHERVPDDLDLVHFKFDQVWKEVPVWGAQVTVHLRQNGSVYYLNGSYYPSPKIEVRPVLSEDGGIQKAVEHYTQKGGSQIKRSSAELKIYTTDGKEFKLAWHVKLQGEELLNGWEYFIDAKNGEVLYRITTTRTDGPVNGSGTDTHGTNRTLHLYLQEGYYYCADATKPMYSPPIGDLDGVIGTFSFGHTTDSYNLVSSSSTTISDAAAVDLHWVFSEIYDFYDELLGRNSWDNAGRTVQAGCHFGENYNNAAWVGSANNIFIFGDGDGEHFGIFTGAFDICCHEFQHAVTEATANLTYHNQPGALNEAYSDISASVFDPDWLIGEDIHTPGVPGDAGRYMDDPTRADLPAHMRDFRYLPDTEEGDWGGVHINMSIPSLAFVNMVDGDPHLSREDAFKVWYRALTTYLTANSEFMDGREGVLRAAEDIYGGTAGWEDTECGIKNAFYNVGIGPDCSGGSGTGEWTGDYVYYWNEDALDYYWLQMPYIDSGVYGFGVRFTIPPGGYQLGAIYFLLLDVWTLYDMVIELYDPSFTLLASNTIPNYDMWYAVYGDTNSFPLLGVDYGEDYTGDVYAFTWLDGYAMYDDYVLLMADDGSGSSEERNYYIDDYSYAQPIVDLYGAEYNIIAFATVTRYEGIEEPAYLHPDGMVMDLHVAPSPFNSEVQITYKIPTEGELVITNMLGQEVKHYNSLAGEGSIHWNATDDNGIRLSSGMYLVSARSEFFPMPLTRKVLYMK